MTSGSFRPVFGALAALSLLSIGGTASAQSTEQKSNVLEHAKAVHSESLVLDAHADIVLPETSATYLDTDGLSKAAPAKLKAGGMGAVVMSVAVGPGTRTEAGDGAARKEAHAKLKAAKVLAIETDSIELTKTPAEIEKARSDGKTALILGFQNARSLGRNVSVIDTYYNAGVRVFGLNHMGHNEFSDSSRPLYIAGKRDYEIAEEHGGLSALGVAAVKRINALGGIIDVSQMSKAATLQTLNQTDAPVIASHSNVRKLSNVSRNLSDEEIDLIGKNGGVIHVAAFGAYLVDLSDPELLKKIKAVRVKAGLPEAYAYPYELYWELGSKEEKYEFLTSMRKVIGRGNVDRMVDHIDYIVKRIGIDHVGIGTDFNHGGGVIGFSNASEALNVTVALIERGYTDDQIKQIWGGNFMRVFRKARSVAGIAE